MINEHDITKNMLETLRAQSSNHKNLIRENEEANGAMAPQEVDNSGQNIDTDAGNEAEAPENEEQEEVGEVLNGGEQRDEEKKFMDIVTAKVTFGELKIFPGSNNVTFSGELDNGIEWEMSKSDGLFINASNIELNDEGLESLRKLNGYYQNWSDEWAGRLNTEYKSDDEE